MKCMLVDSHGLGIVHDPLANRRVACALEKLQDGGYGLAQATNWQPDHHGLGAYRQPESLKALFFPARVHIGSCNKAAERVPGTCHG